MEKAENWGKSNGLILSFYLDQTRGGFSEYTRNFLWMAPRLGRVSLVGKVV